MDPKNKRLVAIIDSNKKHREQVSAVLMSFYDVAAWDNAWEAVLNISKDPPALILVSAQVRPGSSEEFIGSVRQNVLLRDVPIVYIAESRNDPRILRTKAAGADGYIVQPYPRSLLIKTISEHLNASIEHEWEELKPLQRDALKNSVGVFNTIADVLVTGETVSFSSVKGNCQPLVEAIARDDYTSILNGVRNHDNYTYAHSMRVATMLTLLGRAAGFKNDEQLLLASGGLLHDVGKMMIPHHILNKPGKLTEEEFAIMKTHVPETLKYLDACGDIPKAVYIIAEQHHEKIDGTGYPNGLKGAQLNELARMAAVVDVFSALTDRRVYKPSMSAEKAMAIMTGEMTSHLDQHFVKMFEGILGDAGVLQSMPDSAVQGTAS